ncbi:MAG: TIGR01777 family oxidoreductase [Tenuifilaceae bacterium]|nr:TIGR01777 family oxidoreductase [Tenuifilaceae bacterium]
MDEDRKQIIIAGATGLIGRELVNSLLNSGYRIVILSRSSTRSEEWSQSKSVRSILWSGEFTTWLAREVEKSFAVINLAGENLATKPWTQRRRMQLIRSRLGTTRALAKACQYAITKPEVFVQASAIGYYPLSDNEVFDENSDPGTGFLSRLTSDWESIAKHEIPKEIRLVLIRTGVVLSVNGGMLPQLLKPMKLFVGGWFGSGSQPVSWIHIKDEVDAIAHLLATQNASGAFNLVAPNPLSQKQLVKIIAQKTNRLAWVSIPSILVKLLLGKMAEELLLSGNKVEPKRLIGTGFSYTFPTIEKSLADLL